MVNYENFIKTKEWQQLVQYLDSMAKDFVREIIVAGTQGHDALVMHITGKLAMIEELKGMPDYLITYQRQQKGGKNAGEDK
jgi:hypothetical protein